MLGENLPTWLKLLLQFVNFAILVGVILKFATPSFKTFLKKRRQAIAERIQEAQKALDEATSAKARYEEKLSGLDAEIEAFRASMAENLERERQKVLDEARELAARIREQARLAFDQEMKEAMEKVRAEVTAQTIEAATARIRQLIKKDDHDRMVEEFIAKVRSVN